MTNCVVTAKTTISAIKQQIIWEQIIAEWLQSARYYQDSQVNFFVSLNSWQLAGKAIEAWQLLHAWCVPLEMLQQYSWHIESRALAAWAKQYQRICQQNHYQELPEPIANYLEAINSYNYDACKHLISCHKIICADPVQEITQAIKWAQHIYINNPDSTVAIVIDKLEQQYALVEYLANDYLNSSQYIIDCPLKLHKQSAVDIALLIIKLSNCYLYNSMIDYQDISKLLRTKFIAGGAYELANRSYADANLRAKIDCKFDWSYLDKYLAKYLSNSDFLRLWHAFTDYLRQFSHNNRAALVAGGGDCGLWGQLITKVLQLFGWGVDNHVAINIVDSWNEVIEQYLDLSDVLLNHDLTTCMNMIGKVINRSYIETADSVITTNIKFISLTAIANHKNNYDYVWVCGLTEANWPLDEPFNPLLPIALQKQQRPEHASYKLFNKIIYSANKQLVTSIPRYVDNNLVRASNLVEQFLWLDSARVAVEQDVMKVVPEYYQDHNAPEYQSNNFSGVNFLKLQLACPFKANAKTRLQAYKLQQPSNYLTKAVKGEIIHAVLAKFWGKYRSSEVVKQLAAAEIKQQLLIMARQALLALKQHKPYSLSETVLKLESQRIAKLCGNFIQEYDLCRKDFNVKYIEQKFTVKLQDLAIKIKIDRIDELQDIVPQLLLIDYKTGVVSINDLDPQQLIDPQLPIYSLAFENLQGLILAIINNNRLTMQGMVSGQMNVSELLSGKFMQIAYWQQHLSEYYQQLYQVAQQFKQGVASVTPKHGAATCRYCDLQAMCRIHNH